MRVAAWAFVGLAVTFIVALIVVALTGMALQIVLGIGAGICLLIAAILFLVDRRLGSDGSGLVAAPQPVTVHGPVGSIGQTGGHTSQVNIGRLDRTMTGRDSPAAVTALTPYKGTRVAFHWDDESESRRFKDEVQALLRRAGWEIVGGTPHLMANLPHGIVVRIPESDLAGNPALATFVEAIRSLGFAVVVTTGIAIDHPIIQVGPG